MISITLFRVALVIKARSFRNLTWWQKTRITAFLFAGLALLTVAGVSQISVFARDAVEASRLVWLTQTVLPLMTVVVIALFTKAQRGIDLRGGSTHSGKDKSK